MEKNCRHIQKFTPLKIVELNNFGHVALRYVQTIEQDLKVFVHGDYICKSSIFSCFTNGKPRIY